MSPLQCHHFACPRWHSRALLLVYSVAVLVFLSLVSTSSDSVTPLLQQQSDDPSTAAPEGSTAGVGSSSGDGSVRFIPDDGRPQPNLSNYPTPETRNWAYVVAFLLQTIVTLFSIQVAIRYFTHKSNFPCNLLHPIFGVTLMAQPFASFTYTHYVLLGDTIPCWLHIIIAYFPYLTFGWSATALNLRMYVSYNCQHLMAKGDLSNPFLRYRDLTRTYAFEARVVTAYILLTCLVPVVRFSLTPSDVLTMPMKDLRCTSFKTPMFFVAFLVAFVAVVVNVRVNRLVKDIHESYPFRMRYRAVNSMVGRSLLFNYIPLFLKQFWVGADEEVFNNLVWTSYFIFGANYSLPYLYILGFKVTRDAASFVDGRRDIASLRRSSRSSTSSSKVSDVSASGGAVEAYIDDLLVPGEGNKRVPISVTSPSMLRQLILSNANLKDAFKMYLARELCVENILFTDRIHQFRTTIASTAGGTLTALQIVSDYIAVGSPYEVNVSDTQRRLTISAVKANASGATSSSSSSSGATSSSSHVVAGSFMDPNVFNGCEEEAYKMMLDPFKRFVSRAIAEAGGIASVNSLATTTKKSLFASQSTTAGGHSTHGVGLSALTASNKHEKK